MFILFVYIPFSTRSQSLDNLIHSSELIYKETKATLEFSKTSEHQNIFSFSTNVDESKNRNGILINLKKLESSQFLQDIGLVFKANASYNFRNVLEDETNIFNVGRVNLELEWNILKNGYIHNRTRSRELCNEIGVLKHKNLKEEKVLWRRQFRIDYSYIYNKEAIALFSKFLDFENEYFDFLTDVYNKKLIKREPLIKVGNQIHILKKQIEVIEKENAIIKDSVSKNNRIIHKLPLFLLNIDSLQLKHQQVDETPYLKENIVLKHKAINKLSLSIYASQNYLISTKTDQYFPSVGIRFKAPIRFNHRKKIINEELKLLSAQLADREVGKLNRVITQVNSYNEKLKDLQNQYKNWDVTNERIRILKVIKEEFNNEETGYLILGLIEEQFKILQNIIQVKRQLYTILAHIFELHNSNNINSLIKPYYYSHIDTSPPRLLTSHETYSLKFQMQILASKQQKLIYVHKDDIKARAYLKKRNIPFKIISKKENFQTVAEYLNREFKRIFK
ncbi:hypothetical protein [uncultured Tenacibaculum sp.]|uniref:hypothetical protein n=1 Tax=uncultured Tenacibaculum sp. TaxID=174713 RepID=UPI00260AD807|nr:hypothetical protein [uncultured Tenacibaculum sp.]